MSLTFLRIRSSFLPSTDQQELLHDMSSTCVISFSRMELNTLGKQVRYRENIVYFELQS